MAPIPTGTEWVVDAHGCDPESLRSPDRLKAVFDRVVRELGLRAAGEPVWRVFPGEGGVTGLLLLTESHLACHTYPEHGFATVDLHCCRAGARWDFEARLREHLGAARVLVRRTGRSSGAPPA